MDDLIRRSDALKELWYPFDFTRAEIDINIQHIPAVDAVEVRHAHWNKRVDNSGKFRYVEWYCTSCRAKVQTGQPRFAGSYIEHEPKYKYCPFCGARMDGRREDGDGDEP